MQLIIIIAQIPLTKNAIRYQMKIMIIIKDNWDKTGGIKKPATKSGAKFCVKPCTHVTLRGGT